jgi:hypothetical protein
MKKAISPLSRHSRMLLAGIQAEFGLDPRLKHSGVTVLRLIFKGNAKNAKVFVRVRSAHRFKPDALQQIQVFEFVKATKIMNKISTGSMKARIISKPSYTSCPSW